MVFSSRAHHRYAFPAGDHKHIAQAIQQVPVRPAWAEQSGLDGVGGVEQDELVRPCPIDVFAHGLGLPRAHKEIGAAVLAGRQDVEAARQPRVIAEAVMRVLAGGHLPVIGGQDQQRISTGIRAEGGTGTSVRKPC